MYHENKLFVLIKLFHFVATNTFRTNILELVLIKLTITIILSLLILVGGGDVSRHAEGISP